MTETPFPLSRLHISNEPGFVVTIRPNGAMDFEQLLHILKENREFFLKLIKQKGVLLFRGFAPESIHQLNDFVTNGLGLRPWNTFNAKQMPVFLTNWFRRYSEELLGGGDYRTWLETNTVQLGPLDNGIQGPHVEGGVVAKRARFLALCCFESAPRFGETGMVDLNQVYMSLPEERREIYARASNQFYYRTKRKLKWLDRLVLLLAPFRMTRLPDQTAKLALPLCPLVCTIPESGELCLQPWPFARNTNEAVRDAAKQAFVGRGEIEVDRVSMNIDLTWELCDQAGREIPWGASEQREVFFEMFRQAYLMKWQKGDIALVDNLRIGHWRMNGEQGARKLVQIQAEAFDANLLAASR